MKLGVIKVFTTSTAQQKTAILHYKTTSWGKPRNPSTWQTSENVVFKVTARGYTLHEHIALFDIINMNGRLYDAKLGRMLSPDNYIQAPTSTQSYNRYSYAFNNPLKYVDPDGNYAYEGPHKTGTSYGNWNNFPESSRLFGSYSYDNDWKNMKGAWSIEEMINTQAQSTTDGVSSAATYSNGQMTSMIYNYQPRYVPRTGSAYVNDYFKQEYTYYEKVPPIARNNNAGGDEISQSGGGNLINPSGGALRGQDAYGNGHFGAPRDGGGRKHMGIDILTTVGQDLVSPVTGKAVNYTGTTSGKPMIDIAPSDAALGIDKVRILYINMPSGVNAWSPYNVTAGQTLIGTAADLGTLGYPKGITPHIHVQVMVGGKWVDPTPYFFGR